MDLKSQMPHIHEFTAYKSNWIILLLHSKNILRWVVQDNHQAMSCKRQPFPQILLEGFLLHKQGSFLCKYHLSLKVLSFSFTSCVKRTPWPSTRLTNFEIQSCYPINMHSCVLQDVSWRFNLFLHTLCQKATFDQGSESTLIINQDNKC